eukprot:Clim_evm3s61 gene=Clim_evmTU3s61
MVTPASPKKRGAKTKTSSKSEVVAARILDSEQEMITKSESVPSDHMLGGGLYNRTVATSKDGKKFFAADGERLRIYSLRTGQRLHTFIPLPGENIVALCKPMGQRFRLFVCGHKGSIAGMDTLDCSVFRTWQIPLQSLEEGNSSKMAIIDMAPHPTEASQLIGVAMTKSGKNKLMLRLFVSKLNMRHDDSDTDCTISQLGTHRVSLDHDGGENQKGEDDTDTTRKFEVSSVKLTTCGGDMAVMIWNNKCRIYNISTRKVYRVDGKHRYTCIAGDRERPRVALGNAIGEISILRLDALLNLTIQSAGKAEQLPNGDILDEEDTQQHAASLMPPQVPITTLHWHAQGVAAIALSPDGGYCVSGGLEGVMVVWQLSSNAKTFLPRLGSGIVGSVYLDDDASNASGGVSVVLTFANNSVKVVNTNTLQIFLEIKGIHVDAAQERKQRLMIPAPPVLGNRHSVILDAGPGQLQVYDVLYDRHVYTINLETVNVLGPTDHGKVQHRQISTAAFNSSASVLVTVESWLDSARETMEAKSTGAQQTQHKDHATDVSLLFPRSRLSFWSRVDEQAGKPIYRRVALADQPHEANTLSQYHSLRGMPMACPWDIHSVLYHPIENCCWTVGNDGKILKWEPVGGTGRHTRKSTAPSSWTRTLSATYKGMRSQCAALSGDGSTIFVSFGQIITVWASTTLELISTLVGCGPGESVMRLHSTPQGHPILLASTGEKIYIWNLLTGSMQGLVDGHGKIVESIAAGPKPLRSQTALSSSEDACFAVICENSGNRGAYEYAVQDTAKAPTAFNVGSKPLAALCYVPLSDSSTENAALCCLQDAGRLYIATGGADDRIEEVKLQGEDEAQGTKRLAIDMDEDNDNDITGDTDGEATVTMAASRKRQAAGQDRLMKTIFGVYEQGHMLPSVSLLLSQVMASITQPSFRTDSSAPVAQNDSAAAATISEKVIKVPATFQPVRRVRLQAEGGAADQRPSISDFVCRNPAVPEG